MSTEIDDILIKYPLPSYDEEEFQQDLCKLAKASGIPKIIIDGQTPTFNDGDICRHSEYVYPAKDDSWRFRNDVRLAPIRALAHVREALYDTNYRITLTTDESGVITFNIEDYNSEW